MAANSLAWILATDRDEDVRNGDAALKWAQIAVQGKRSNDPEFLDTLAAAYAESGQFAKAVRVGRHALTLARAGGDTALSKTIEGRLLLYESGRPFYE